MKPPFSFEEFHRVERLLRTPDYHDMLKSDIATARERLTLTPSFEMFFIEPPHTPTSDTSEE